MSAFMDKLLALPAATQKLVAFAILAGFLAILVAFASVAALQLEQMRQKTLSLREELGQRQQIVGQLPDLRSSQGNLLAGDEFLRAPSLSLGRARLQERVTSIAQSRDLAIASLSNLSEIERNGVTWVGLDVTVTGANNALHSFVTDLETNAPQFIISRFTARSSASPDEDLNVQIRILVPFLEQPV